jgi:hypothetical protein
MRKLIVSYLAAVLLCTPIVLSSSAHAQLKLTVNQNEPITGLDSATWAEMMTRFVNAKPLIGKDNVYIVNATPYEVPQLTCGRWTLVGNKPYITDNPTTLPAWSVTEISTKGFDGYCKEGVFGQSAMGTTLRGALSAADGSFTNSTFIIFKLIAK